MVRSTAGDGWAGHSPLLPTASAPTPLSPVTASTGEAQKELDASVKRLGILQPITVRYVETENVYRIITGDAATMPQ